MFEAKVLADSINRMNNSRLTTVQLTYPRIIHSEFMTHRLFSRNAASSRAIPVEKMIRDVNTDPFIPIHWGKNQKGMQADRELTSDEQVMCHEHWLQHRDISVTRVQNLIDIGLHKQIANRLLEPWMWITVIASGVDIAYRNFFRLRCHPDAEPHIQKIAYILRDVYLESTPVPLNPSRPQDIHLPLFGITGDESITLDERPKVSTARCARVSYLTHDGLRDPDADIVLHDRLATSGHWSPFEHVAFPSLSYTSSMGGNFGSGWTQYRKTFQTECE